MAERNVSAFGFDLNPKLIIVLIVLAVLGYAGFQSVYIVDQTEEAVVLTFGKYSRTEGPGMKFKIPLIEENYNVPTKQVQKMDFGFRMDGQGGDIFAQDTVQTNFKNESTMLTGDLNIVDITWIIQYRITDARAWLFNLDANSREKTIRDISQSAVSQLVGDRAILDVLGNERQSIEVKATEMINELFASYGIGVLVTGTQLKDIFPPEGSVKAAFDDVNVAFQDMNRLINEGREKYNKQIPQAAGEAQAWQQRQKAGVSPSLGLPTRLAADLRPYQLEGFRWLARLSEVGAGACLADDMGLGKTVQTIALLAHRAALGPALVLAPTSVAPNWRDEIRRFDRTLEPVLLAEGGREDRHRVVVGLGPGQVLVATYGLLVTERDLLAGREWSTLVLDEAQAVKNAQAQRTKAALTLKAAFRLALTGTPLQNHLGELWSLFEFLNPGLLGTKTSFQDRFWGPIEGKKDEGARRSLQALVRPFLLRRTKNQVLGDLPAKIEATLAVDLGPEERDWYEALRRQALLEMTEKPNQHLQVLAHLMRLRRACCHSTLAGGPATSSAKLDRLEQLLEDLIDNGHRTLVFSQFTDHLALIRQRIRARGWAWEELDGSTPSAERTARVARFQGGQTPIFLISLQAGGTGLNLTGADYVVHMDPWWNPAVEDQASDRAHRLGQTRPVTIYRLVARDTIEERIVDLHHTKRDLADALLEGTEAAGRLGPDELMALISESGRS